MMDPWAMMGMWANFGNFAFYKEQTATPRKKLVVMLHATFRLVWAVLNVSHEYWLCPVLTISMDFTNNQDHQVMSRFEN